MCPIGANAAACWQRTVELHTLAGMKFAALVVAAALALMTATASPIDAQQITVNYGGVVRLVGTPHIWVSAGGQLHWAGDTRALDGHYVNWGESYALSAETIRTFPIGDPWLSSGLVKSGDPIYLAKWETNERCPRLLHIQSIADVELFGINGTNYGRFVLDQSEWENRTGFRASILSRGTLERTTSVPPTATPRPLPTATARPLPTATRAPIITTPPLPSLPYYSGGAPSRGPEWVSIYKEINYDNLLVVRSNGELWLIEEGVGCLSAHEGRRALVVSGSTLFGGVGSRLLLPDYNQECRIWNAEYVSG